MSTETLVEIAEPVSGEDTKTRRYQLPHPSEEGGIIFVLYRLYEKFDPTSIEYHEKLNIKCHPGGNFGYEIREAPYNPPRLTSIGGCKLDKTLVAYLREHLPEEAAKILPKE